MPHLFMIYVGGEAPGCHVELHDVRFAVGETIEDCTPALKAQWWGTPGSLHLDAWGPVDWADGYRVEVADAPASTSADQSGARLFFCNMGGYDPAQFTELHENVLLVAEDARAARRKAIDRIRHWDSPHKDAILECENVIDVAVAAGGAHLRLTPDLAEQPFAFEARYVPIGRM